MGLGLIELLVLLGAGVFAIFVARRSSWKALVAVPIVMLVLLASFTIVWSVAASRYVAYSPVVVPAVELSPSAPASETFYVNGVRSRVEMQRSHVPYATGPSVLTFGLGMMCVFGVVTAATLAGRRLLAGNQKPANRLFAVGGVFLMLLGLGALLFAGAVVPYSARQQAPAFALPPPPQPPQPITVAAASLATLDPADTVTKSSSLEAELPASAPVDLPEWARNKTVSYRDLRDWNPQNPAVLVSDEWSSLPESEVQLEAMAALVLQQQLQMNYGPTFDWRPSNDFLHQSGSIQRRFTRQTSLKVGEFESPMYQTYWEVSATPQVSNLAQVAWRSALAEHRLLCLGGAAVGLTMLFASIAAALRFDAATGGRHRQHLFAAAGFVSSIGAAMLLFG